VFNQDTSYRDKEVVRCLCAFSCAASIADAEETLLNKCLKRGDIFSLHAFFIKQLSDAEAEETIVYAIPIATFRPFVANNSLKF
jgi:hypothetical protein